MSQKELIDILLELLQTSKSIKNEIDLRNAMNTYDMTFFGKNLNTINSLELCHSLSKHFHINISKEELNSLIPSACSALGMKIEPMAAVNDLSNPIPYCYRIELW